MYAESPKKRETVTDVRTAVRFLVVHLGVGISPAAIHAMCLVIMALEWLYDFKIILFNNILLMFGAQS